MINSHTTTYIEEQMNENIEAFTQRDSFSLTDFLSDKKYPTEDVTIYTDAQTMNERLKIQVEIAKNDKKIAELKSAIDSAAVKSLRTLNEVDDVEEMNSDIDILQRVNDELRAKFPELDDKIEKSSLTFHLQGLPPYLVESISDKYFVDRKKNYTNTPEEDERDFELIASTIEHVTTHDGRRKVGFSIEDVKTLKGRVIDGEYYKLVSTVAHVNLNGALFDMAVDAPFLSRRTDMAGE